MSNEKTTYELVVKKQRIVVSKEVYKAYYECKERERYLDKLNKKYNVSLEKIVDEGYPIEINGVNVLKDSAEKEALRNINKYELRKIIGNLEKSEIILLKEIFEYGYTERELATKMGISQQMVHHRKMICLKKLHKLLKDFN